MLRVLTTLYNARPFIDRCIKTIREQSIRDWRCYVLNDLSTDGSDEDVARTAKHDDRIILINHSRKLYQVGAYLNAISRSEIADDDICVTVDGDDWLPDRLVFQRVLDAYSDRNIWLTWGSMVIFQDDTIRSSELCQPISNWENVREHKWVTSHLRTWKAFLFRAINPRDLKDAHGNYWRVSGDRAFMLPMLEMAGPDHGKFLPEINYVYNNTNPLSDHRVNYKMQFEILDAIRALPPYARLADVDVSN
jgi:glycosyltransferase involved in cell wall biosynthesis